MANDHDHPRPDEAAVSSVNTAEAATTSPTTEPAVAPPPAAREEQPHGWSWASLLTSAAVALAFGGLGSWAYSRFLAGPTPPPPEAARKEAEPAKANLSNEKEFADLKGSVDRLAAQIEQLQSQVAAAPKNQTRLEVESLKNRIDKIEAATSGVSATSEKVGAFDERLDAVNKQVESVRDDLSAFREQVGLLVEGGKAGAATRRVAARPAPAADEDRPLDRGQRLFAKGDYAEALKAFQRAQEDDPDDARTWYGSALANGFSTGKWDGETERLVKKGVEREKAGTPGRDQIDAAFEDLKKSTKTWLDYYRKQAK